MLAQTNGEENILLLFERIALRLDEIDLNEAFLPETISSFNVAETKKLPLVEASWKLAILLNQKKSQKMNTCA